MKKLIAAAFALLLAFACTVHAADNAPAAPDNKQFVIKPIDDAWRAALPRDAEAATQAFMDRLPKETVERANNYFEGGYWLLLWNLVLGLAITWVLLAGGRSARFRDWAYRKARRPFLADAIFAMGYWLAAWVLSAPLAIYQNFIREHQYGMATQGFGAWFGEQLIALAIGIVVSAILVPPLFAFIRKLADRWWLAATGLVLAFQVLAMVVAPVWIEPLFNTYKPVTDPVIKASVLAMAHANGVPANDIYEVDASRQTTRVSANVSGGFGNAQIRLNDNLLRKSSLGEIRSVMGHELGHYVMNHQYKFLVMLAFLFMVGFAFTQWGTRAALRRWGEGWGLKGEGDVAALPLLAAVVSVFFFVATPVTNTLIRVQEIEADRFALNLAQEPIAEAEVDLKLTEYRKPDPGPIEEFLFFDHPSTRFRVHDAMRWREAMRKDAPDKPWSAAKP
ncbi:M48 family metallopeptidase [Ramlibacter sp. PS4R-6]|uniref:M48 family metallopeptidase n=1 Tax=Ramlibacter sp. PS4R-6 TaxID=3133438 RepID=UPI0030A0F8AC